MNFLVTVSLELKTNSPTAIAYIENEFDVLGLYKKLKGKNRLVDLPKNTYCGEFNGASSIDVREYILENIKGILNRKGLGASYFVTVGTGWTWSKGNT